MKTMAISEFKAQALKVLNEVAKSKRTHRHNQKRQTLWPKSLPFENRK